MPMKAEALRQAIETLGRVRTDWVRGAPVRELYGNAKRQTAQTLGVNDIETIHGKLTRSIGLTGPTATEELCSLIEGWLEGGDSSLETRLVDNVKPSLADSVRAFFSVTEDPPGGERHSYEVRLTEPQYVAAIQVAAIEGVPLAQLIQRWTIDSLAWRAKSLVKELEPLATIARTTRAPRKRQSEPALPLLDEDFEKRDGPAP